MMKAISSQEQKKTLAHYQSSLKVVRENSVHPPILDTFMLIALFGGGLIGAALGLWIWLMRLGVIPYPHHYTIIRQLHALAGLYVFFGVAIIGFVLQATPRLFNLGPLLSERLSLMVAILPLLGLILRLTAAPAGLVSLILASGPALIGACLIVRQRLRVLRPHSLFIITSLIGFSATAYIDSSDPLNAITAFWFTTGFALLGTAHLFIANLLGGQSIGTGWFYALYVLSLCGGILLSCGLTSYGAISLLICLGLYCIRSKLFTITHGPLLLRSGFILGFGWALLACLILAVNPWRIDQTLHLLAIGWGVPILFVLSLHITTAISVLPASPSTIPMIMLLLWQALPMSRGLLYDMPLPAVLLVALGITLLTFWSYWLSQIAKRSRAIHNRRRRGN